MAAETEKAGATQAGALEFGDFASLLNKEFRPQTDHAKTEVEKAVRTLAEQALQSSVVVKGDVVETIKSIIGAIDRKIG